VNEELTYTESMWVLESVRAEITHEEEWAKAEKAQAELLEELNIEDKKKKKKKKKQGGKKEARDVRGVLSLTLLTL
jgi:ABC-type lipopolysaccharide export system ATPase subunit